MVSVGGVKVNGVVVRIVVERKKVRVGDHVVRRFVDSILVGGVVRVLVVKSEIMVKVGVVRIKSVVIKVVVER